MGHSERYERYVINARIRLSAFAFNHSSEIVTSDDRTDVSLINVHHKGARLRVPRSGGSAGFRAGDHMKLNLRLHNSTHETENLDCQVFWADGDEFQVRFDTPLTIGVTDLQNLLAH